MQVLDVEDPVVTKQSLGIMTLDVPLGEEATSICLSPVTPEKVENSVALFHVKSPK